jgi:autophagy-related protein 101
MSLIDTQSRTFLRYVESLPATKPESGDSSQAVTRAQIAVHFYEKVTRRASWWASKPAESEVCWEKWNLNCEFLAPARNDRGCQFNTMSYLERVKARKTMEQQLAKASMVIVQETEKTDHIPPITTNEANPFPYQVYILDQGLIRSFFRPLRLRWD